MIQSPPSKGIFPTTPMDKLIQALSLQTKAMAEQTQAIDRLSDAIESQAQSLSLLTDQLVDEDVEDTQPSTGYMDS